MSATLGRVYRPLARPLGSVLLALGISCVAGACASNHADDPSPSRSEGDPDASALIDGAPSIPGDSAAAVDGADAAIDPAIAEMHDRADQAASTMMLRYWSQLSTQTNNSYWTYAHDWDVILDAYERRGPGAYAGTLRMFYEVQNARGWSRDFYDDENWMVLTLTRAYDLTGDVTYLAQAKALFADVMSAWDTTCCGAHFGGIWWRTMHDSKVTAINAGAVVSASRLFERTNDAAYLAFAQKAYTYWSTYMVDPATGHVYDGISSAGVINTAWTFTYNEGLMIGAAVALAHAEKDPSRLALAHTIAKYSMAKESAAVPLGVILSDGNCGKPGGDDGEQFKGVAARYLAQLYLADPSHTEYRDFLHRSADAAWTLARDPSTGLISCDWAGPYTTNSNSVNSLSSAAMTLAVTANVLGPAAKRAPLVYEAEEGDLHAVGLEATHAGFGGWGYVAGWGADGQWVDVLVEVATSGTYDVDLKYASVDAPSRLIYVNGVAVTPNLAFPTTGDYGTYATVRTSVPLLAGKNVISVIYNAGQGSHGFLNLDRLQLTLH